MLALLCVLTRRLKALEHVSRRLSNVQRIIIPTNQKRTQPGAATDPAIASAVQSMELSRLSRVQLALANPIARFKNPAFVDAQSTLPVSVTITESEAERSEKVDLAHGVLASAR